MCEELKREKEGGGSVSKVSGVERVSSIYSRPSLTSPRPTFPHHMNNGRRTKPISSPPPPLCYWFYYCTHTGEGGAVGRLEFFLLSSYSQGRTFRRLKSRGMCGGNYEKGTTPWVWGKWMNDPYGVAGKCGRELIDRTFRIDFVQWLLASFRNTLLWPLKVTQMDDEKAVYSR